MISLQGDCQVKILNVSGLFARLCINLLHQHYNLGGVTHLSNYWMQSRDGIVFALNGFNLTPFKIISVPLSTASYLNDCKSFKCVGNNLRLKLLVKSIAALYRLTCQELTAGEDATDKSAAFARVSKKEKKAILESHKRSDCTLVSEPGHKDGLEVIIQRVVDQEKCRRPEEADVDTEDNWVIML